MSLKMLLSLAHPYAHIVLQQGKVVNVAQSKSRGCLPSMQLFQEPSVDNSNMILGLQQDKYLNWATKQ